MSPSGEDTAGPDGPDPAESIFRALTPFEVDLLVTLARTIQRRYPGGLPPWTHEQAHAFGERMVDAYPDAGIVDDVIGPAFTTRGLSQYWETTPATVRRRARAGKLLTLKTTTGALVFPEFQFDRDGDVVAGLREVVAIVARRFPDPWDRARWLATPSEPSPIRLLRAPL